ncbi:Asp-tRNA(Asn)/Glu-tRNA(Gln) amidotransferase subunit GatB [Acidianus sulfidivorans JP7]|uniref:Aspartyl/glutamyl-tRNA(Asn/Gln) amidotransferase subunit B n=1 Tax=Acidianus sulfidivorans JP7 TaxID=619593 RepID=A0A2U9IMG5_9CREN|nr:Asp-tRNA(Asn)/Glu-tRNA(Gln) amidotransferase subunit GatB [Acidianus sulfidivorans]AWR97207.1 Asp-tRNA(Asn)/Glu-tRNA(Gln) amidotransferase subunit GatB [Acidianus sulfidivorans JP7]
MPKVGLEVHIHLNTLKTKLFCSCPTDYVGKDPNTVVCPVCLGLPGAIPVLNEEALRKAIMVAIALNCEIAPKLVFSRKHYFYPDMAKNYQISQYDGPGSMAIAKSGYLILSNNKKIRIRRINIEEDPAKIIYPTGSMLSSSFTYLDYNRSGIGLLEIVSEPDISDSKEAREFLEKLRSILEHLGVCNCEAEGAMRADVNVSVEGGERVEVKNVGSIKDIEEAIKYEIARQKAAVSQGLKVLRETRHWDAERRVSVPTRLKEADEDYRYFPDPDLPPYDISQEFIEKIKLEMPELPDARAKRMVEVYNISEYDAKVLVSDKALADLFENTAKIYKDYKKLANLLLNDYLRWINDKDLRVSDSKATPETLSELLKLMDSGIISIKILKQILPQIVLEGKNPRELIEKENLVVIKDESYLEKIIDDVIAENQDAAKAAKNDPKVLNFLVGQVMKKTKGKADPKITNDLLRKKIYSM